MQTMNCAWKFTYFGFFLVWTCINAEMSPDDLGEYEARSQMLRPRQRNMGSMSGIPCWPQYGREDCHLIVPSFTSANETILTDEGANETKIFEEIHPQVGETVTLLCHPRFEHITKMLGKTDFEWITDHEIPIYTKGRLSPFLFFAKLDGGESYEMQHSSLVIRNIEPGEIKFTCMIPRLELNYTYFVQVNSSEWAYVQNRERVIDGDEGETLILPCVENHEIFIANLTYTWLSLDLDKNTIEVISFGKDIILENDITGYEIDDNASLIIPYYWPSDRIRYECRLSNGEFVSYRTRQESMMDAILNSRSIEKNITVEQGNMVVLKCPIPDFIEESEFIWVRNDSELLFINTYLVNKTQGKNFRIFKDGRSLGILNYASSLNGIYRCLSQRRPIYVYYISEQNSANETKLVSPRKAISLPCPRSNAEYGSYFVWVRNETEYLFINNRSVANSEIDKLRISNDGRSLIITKMTSALQGEYQCRLSSGINYTYNVMLLGEDKSLTIKQDMILKTGTKRVELPCPGVDNGDDDWYEWQFSDKYGSITLLYLKGEKFATTYSNYYEINDTSLVILLLDAHQFGVYTCRWSNDVQYVYNISEKMYWSNRTVIVDRGTFAEMHCATIGNDDNLEMASWVLPLNYNLRRERFSFAAGKLTPNSTYFLPIIPYNIAFEDYGRTVIVRNITEESEGDYICTLVASSNSCKYTLKSKAPSNN